MGVGPGKMAIAYKVAGNRMSYNGAGNLGGVSQSAPKENPWQPYKLKLFAKKINDVWYLPGDTVYRKQQFGPGGVSWVYGDHFDYLKWQ